MSNRVHEVILRTTLLLSFWILYSEGTEKYNPRPTEEHKDTVTVLYGAREEALPGLDLESARREKSRPGGRGGTEEGYSKEKRLLGTCLK